MKNNQILIALGVVAALVAAYFLIYKKQPSKTAKDIKQQLTGYDKFRAYLKETLTPEQLRKFREWKLLIEGYSNNDPEAYERWMKGAKDEAKTYNIPEEVALDRGLLWQMTQGENKTLSGDLWKQIHVDSIYLYR
jgi:predicted acetyltransferase